jgi:putative DNA primase/helicase
MRSRPAPTCCKCKTSNCSLLLDCLYQGQKTAASEADIVYAAHEALFQATESIGEGFGLVVIDEGFWQDGLNVKPTWRLAIEGLATELKDFPVVDHGGRALVNDTGHLRTLIEKVQHALGRMPDGEVQRQPLLDEGLIPSNQPLNFNVPSCVAAVKMEWARKIDDIGLRPDTSDTDREKLVAKFGFLGQLQRRVHMWGLLDELISGPDPSSGRLRIETVNDGSGPVRYLRLLERMEIVAGLAKLPIIVADATLPEAIVREFLPNLSITGGHTVTTPHQRITQVLTGRMGVGKSSLQPLPPGKRTPEEEDRVRRKRERLIALCRHLFDGKRGLVITYQSIEDEFRAAGLEVAHFGAIEGIDKWKDVDVLVIIGRTLPRPEDIRDLAAAVTGQPVPLDDPEEEIRFIHSRNGRPWPLHCLTYPTEEAETVRAAVTEAGLIQAIGRARGVNRKAGNEVEIFLIVNDVVIPGLTVDAVELFQDMEPNAVDEMWLRGVVMEWPSDAARVWPDLFRNREAAKKAYQRASKRNGLFRIGELRGDFP